MEMALVPKPPATSRRPDGQPVRTPPRPAAALFDALRASGAEGRTRCVSFSRSTGPPGRGATTAKPGGGWTNAWSGSHSPGERCAVSPSANALRNRRFGAAYSLAELLAHIRDHALPEAPSHPHHAAADVAPGARSVPTSSAPGRR